MWRRRTRIGVVGEEKDRDTDGPLENASSAPLTWSFLAVMLTRLACENQTELLFVKSACEFPVTGPKGYKLMPVYGMIRRTPLYSGRMRKTFRNS